MNQMTITVKDEAFNGKVLNEITIALREERVTVRELIEARVWAEVEAYNKKVPEYYNGLVQPSDAEQTLNGYRLKNRKNIDAEQQVYVALDAFQKNGFFILVNNVQAETLDQVIRINENSHISFIKLTPLVGG